MTNLTLRSITGAHPDEIEVKKNYYLRYYDADASNLEEAMDSVERGLEDLKAFLVAGGSPIKQKMHHKALMEVLEDPVHANAYRIIAKENPYVLPTIAVGVEANMMSIETGTQLFEGVDFFEFDGDEEEVVISPPLTGPSPERIQELSDRFKPLTGADLPKGDVNTVLTFLFNKLRIPIEAQPGKPVVLKLRQFLDTLAVLMVGEPKEHHCPHLRDTYDHMRGLEPAEWFTTCPARMAHAELHCVGLNRTGPLERDPVPPRDVAYPEVARDMCNFFDSLKNSSGPANLDWLKDMLSKGGEVGGNYDAPKQPSDELLACPNEGQTQAPNLTAGPTISSPPNAERPCAEAGDAERPSSELKSLEVSTDCKRNFAEAQIEVHESLASVGSSNSASDEERFAAFRKMVHSEVKVMLDTSLAVFRAELKTLVVNEIRTMTVPQTSASGEGGATDVLRTTSQGPKQCVLCGASNGPPNQSRNAQEARETGARGSETTAATGDDNAGAIPRPVASKPNNEQKEGGEKAPAEAEIGQKARGYRKYAAFICIFAMLAVFVAYWVIYYKSRRINCDAGKEAAAAFCPSNMCVREVNTFCFQKRSLKNQGVYRSYRSELEAEEKDIIERFM